MALVRSDLGKVDEIAERFIRLADQANLQNGACLGHRVIGYASLVRGDIRRASEFFDLAVKEFDPLESRFDLWPVDLHSASMSQDVLVLQQQGHLDKAVRRAEAALARAQSLGSPDTELYVLYHMALAHMIAGAVDPASQTASAMHRVADRSGGQHFRWHEDVLLGWIEAKSGALEEGITRMRRGLELRHRWMDNIWVPLYVLSQAELLIESGRNEQAFPIFGQCEELFVELQQRYVEPELHRLRALALHATRADPEAVEASFELALRAARSQGARLFELRAATCRARIWRAQGRREEARTLLAPLFAQFSAGSEALDWRQAQAMLTVL